MNTNPRSAIVASLVGASFAVAIAVAPLAPAVADVSPNGAVKPMAAPGAFLNAPTTTNQYGGQESLTFDTQGHMVAVGRTALAPSGTVRMSAPMKTRTAATTRTATYGHTKGGVWVAPRVSLPTNP